MLDPAAHKQEVLARARSGTTQPVAARIVGPKYLAMDLRHLRHFVAVAEELHFGRAAARLGIEQSPLSRSIRELEGHLKTDLLTRSPRGSQLTPAGLALIAPARAILAQAAGLRGTAAHARRVEGSTLRFGVCDSVATPRLSGCFSALRTVVSDLRIELVSLPSVGAAAAVESGTIDVAVTLGPTPTPALTRLPGWRDPFLAVGHELAGAEASRREVLTELLAATEVLAADAWATAAEHWLETLVGGNRNAPSVRPVGTVLTLLATLTANKQDVALFPAGFATALRALGVGARAVARHGLPVQFLHRPDRNHPALSALRSVLAGEPRAVRTPPAASPAGTLGRGP